MSRRTTIAFVVALVLVLAVSITPTFARLAWCSTDPIVTLPDGRVVSVLVEAPVEFAGSEVKVKINAPHGAVLDSVLPGDLVLNVKYKDNESKGEFKLAVDPEGKFPVRVTVSLDNQVVKVIEGETSESVEMEFKF